ncbi:MAG: hypothetical protein B7X38_11910 [Stenotrophomonas sp. 14-69-23]|jgi:hypothetical protein|nr:MAG: hypothetical protein B7X38_11910 [Stenotrophomonas sp. 14-69-23]
MEEFPDRSAALTAHILGGSSATNCTRDSSPGCVVFDPQRFMRLPATWIRALSSSLRAVNGHMPIEDDGRPTSRLAACWGIHRQPAPARDPGTPQCCT